MDSLVAFQNCIGAGSTYDNVAVYDRKFHESEELIIQFILEYKQLKIKMHSIKNKFIKMIAEFNETSVELEILKREMEKFDIICKVILGISIVVGVAGSIGVTITTFGLGLHAVFGCFSAGGWFTSMATEMINIDVTRKSMANIMKFVQKIEITIQSMEPTIDFIVSLYPTDGAEAAVLTSTKEKIYSIFKNIREILGQTDATDHTEPNGIFENIRKMQDDVADLVANRTGLAGRDAHHFMFLAVILQSVNVIVFIRKCMRDHVTVEKINDIVLLMEELKKEYIRILNLMLVETCI